MNDVPINLKTTPLYQLLKEWGGQFTEFGGYYMPLNFKEGIVYEHLSVRNNSGLFDVSHMGEIRIKGKDASKLLNYVSTNNINKINNNQVQYHILCNEDGGVIDDMLAYKFNDEDLWFVCNASNQEVVYKHLVKVLSDKEFEAEVINEGDDVAVISVQGPNAFKDLEEALGSFNVNHMSFINKDKFIISRTGYTGEDGFEVYGSPSDINNLTKELLEQGTTPCGLGARDTLRFEAGLPLFGHELSSLISPVEAGLNFAIDFNKDNFIGKTSLLAKKANLENKIVGLELLDRAIAREGYPVYDDNKIIGHITSGFMIPGTKLSYANAYIKNDYKIGDIIQIEVRNKKINAKIRNKRYITKKGEEK